MLAALLLSFAVIFVAEMGDKTQLVAMMFALRYRWWIVLSAIFTATIAVHLVSVAIGHYLGAALPTHLLGILAGAMFVFFGLWTLRGDSLGDDEASKTEKATAPAFFVVTSAFFLAELGDKTMLATVTLAADKPWLPVWIGSTIGMVAADALAILGQSHQFARCLHHFLLFVSIKTVLSSSTKVFIYRGNIRQGNSLAQPMSIISPSVLGLTTIHSTDKH